MPHRALPRVGMREAWLLLVLTVLALALRVGGLDSRSVWEDETIALRWASLPLLEIPRALLRFDSHPPLLYALLHVWLPLAGNDVLLRLPSAIAGSLVVPVTYALGRHLASARVGLTAALLMAVAPSLVWHSQESRPYALLTLLISLAALLALQLRQSGRWQIVGYAVVAAAALYTHYASLFLVGGLAAATLASSLGWRPPRFTALSRRVLGANLLAAAGFAPWGLVIGVGLMLAPATYTQSYIPVAPDARATARELLGILDPYWSTWPNAVRLLVIIVQVGVFGLGVWRLPARARSFVGTWLVVSLGLGALLAMRYPVFWQSKVLLPLLPLVMLVLASGLIGLVQFRKGGVSLAVLGGLGLGAILLAQLVQLYLPQPFDRYATPLGPWTEDWRGASRYVEAHAAAGEHVAVLSYSHEQAFRRADPDSPVLLDRMPDRFESATALTSVPEEAGPGFWLLLKAATDATTVAQVDAAYNPSTGWRIAEQTPFAGLIARHYVAE